MIPSFADFAQVAAPLAVRSLWQGLAVAALLALGLRLAPRITAAQRFVVWAAGFLVAAGLPFLPALAARFVSSPPPSLAAAAPSAWLVLDPRWSLAIAAFWFAASAYRAVDLAVHTVRLRSLWRSATPIDMPHTAGGRRFEVCTTNHVDRPSVIGFFAPRILIPGWLLARLTSAELDQIVLHESEHLSRRDDWTNLLQKLCLVAFPLNVALWGIDRRLAREREMACDEGVIRVTRAPRAYAACLASLAERGLARRTEALSLGAWQRRPELVQRVHSILRSRRALHPIAAHTLLGGLVCGLLVVSFELAQCPQLVAFAPSLPAPVLTAAQQHFPAAETSDAVFASQRRSTPRFRAVPAKAVLPSRRDSARHLNPKPSANEPDPVFTEQLASIQLPTAPSNAPGGQQWIVLTAWEQVETEQRGPQPTADYAANQTDSANSAGVSTGRIRVTQLIFKVVPTKAGSAHAKSSGHTPQPAAVPLGDGWFVIQL